MTSLHGAAPEAQLHQFQSTRLNRYPTYYYIIYVYIESWKMAAMAEFRNANPQGGLLSSPALPINPFNHFTPTILPSRSPASTSHSFPLPHALHSPHFHPSLSLAFRSSYLSPISPALSSPHYPPISPDLPSPRFSSYFLCFILSSFSSCFSCFIFSSVSSSYFFCLPFFLFPSYLFCFSFSSFSSYFTHLTKSSFARHQPAFPNCPSRTIPSERHPRSHRIHFTGYDVKLERIFFAVEKVVERKPFQKSEEANFTDQTKTRPPRSAVSTAACKRQIHLPLQGVFEGVLSNIQSDYSQANTHRGTTVCVWHRSKEIHTEGAPCETQERTQGSMTCITQGSMTRMQQGSMTCITHNDVHVRYFIVGLLKRHIDSGAIDIDLFIAYDIVVCR